MSDSYVIQGRKKMLLDGEVDLVVAQPTCTYIQAGGSGGMPPQDIFVICML